MIGRNMLFYAVAGTVIAVIAERAGAGMGMTMMLSLVVPPIMLLALGIYRYNRRF